MFCKYIFISTGASPHSGVHFIDILTSESVPTIVCFLHLTWKCASRHKGVHFFDISTFKCAPKLTRFDTFCFQMCSRHNGVRFFDISTSKSAPRPTVLNTFQFRMCFVPTTACKFYFLICPNVSAPVASEPTFRPSGVTKHWKNAVFGDFPTFSRSCIFSRLTFYIFYRLHFFSSHVSLAL